MYVLRKDSNDKRVYLAPRCKRRAFVMDIMDARCFHTREAAEKARHWDEVVVSVQQDQLEPA